MGTDLRKLLVAVISRVEASRDRLASAPDDTAARARNHAHAHGSADPRRDMAFHQVGGLEQTCHNEAAVLSTIVEWLRAATQ